MKRILQHTLSVLNSKERQRFYTLMVVNTIVSMVDIAALALLVFVVGFYTQSVSTSSVLSQWLAEKDSLLLICIFFVFFTIKSIAAYIAYRAQYKFVYGVASRISADSLLHYLEGDYSNYVNVPPAVHIRRISDYPIQFAQYILFGLQSMFTEIVLATLSVVGILLFNYKLFFVLLVVLLPAVIILAYYTRHRLKEARTHAKAASEESLQYLQEALSGYVESNIYDKNSFFIQRFSKEHRKLSSYLSDVQIVQSLPSRLAEIFAVLGLLILITVSIWWHNTAAGAIINIGAFMIAAYKLIPGIVKISNISGQIKTYQYTIDNLLKVKNKAGRGNSNTLIHEIAFHNVSFSHAKEANLINLDLEIKPGAMVGIAGASGKGKTTIIKLLLGFLTPDKGTIRINNTEADPVQLQQYWHRIAYVKQHPFLIHDTILKNITLDDNEQDNVKLREIFSITGLDTLMQQWQDGLDKIITDNGKNISGGQRQRIAIARALYKDADLIILDEPFNELDSTSEHLLLAHFKRLAENGKMVILITHNKDSLSQCNKLISLGE